MTASDAGTYVVTLRKVRSTWYYYTKNPEGGGFGSNHCGARKAALNQALINIPAGASYRLIIDERDHGMHVQP